MCLLIAQGCTLFGLANNICCWLFPEKMIGVYKTSKDPRNVHIFQYRAAAMLSCGIVTGYVLFKDPDGLHQGLALAQIPWFLQAMNSYFIKQSYKTLGTSPSDDLVVLVLCPLWFGCLWIENSLSNYAAFVNGSMYMITGLSMALTPERHEKNYCRGKNPLPGSFMMSLRAMGLACTAIGTFALAQLSGLDGTQAFGLSWISFAAMSLLPSLLMTKRTDPGLSHESSLVWVEKISQLLSLSHSLGK